MKKNKNGKTCMHPNCEHKGKILPLEMFYKRSIAPDGRHDRCRDCVGKLNRENSRKRWKEQSDFFKLLVG